MKIITIILLIILGFSNPVSSNEEKISFQLDYDKMVILDAENLAEQGINEAYNEVRPLLQKYVDQPALVEEVIDNNVSIYKVSSQDLLFEIYTPELEDSEGQSWGRATYALFTIVNNQLKNKGIKFYAINSGNSLGGMFLTAEQVKAARESLSRKLDWPYIPTDEHPWYGQNH